jgi:hypothetical protein
MNIRWKLRMAAAQREVWTGTPARPHSGNDTSDLVENALRELAGRRSRWPGDPLTAITLPASLTTRPNA